MIDFDEFGFEDYLVKTNESPREIAQKLNLNEYKIFELNPHIHKYQPLESGEKIRLPNCYARRIEITVDSQNFLPVRQKIYDDLGLFEVYEFIGLELNPEIELAEFEN